MEEYERILNSIVAYFCLLVAIVAIIAAVVTGAWHQCFVALVAFIMFLCQKPGKKEKPNHN